MSDGFEEWNFPVGGIDTGGLCSKQRPRKIGSQPQYISPTGWAAAEIYGRTTRRAMNMRSFEPGTNRKRGGSRAGLSKYLPVKVAGATFITQELSTIVITGNGVQNSQSGRVVWLVAVSEGIIKVATSGDVSWTTPTNRTGEDPALNFTGTIFSAANAQKLYFADGVNWVYYDPHKQEVATWAATAGTLPVDEDGNLPRLICTWRGRTVLAGLLRDQQNWFMSAVDDPTDFDYSPTSQTPTQAIAGNNAPQGLIGDMITGLCPYTDDVLIFFGDHSVYMMRGDPFNGGQIDKITDAVGAAWGQAFCMDPFGTVYVFSNRGGIYSLIPGNQPQRISQPIEDFVQSVDTGANSIRLLWNDRQQGVHVFITPLDEPAVTTHLFYEARTGAWWMDSFADTDMNPLCCVTFDGNLPTDRVQLIGSWDGFVRAIDHTATTDDGDNIVSEVVMGPLTTKDLDELLLLDHQGVLGENSGNVNYEVYVGETAEEALGNDPVDSGIFLAGRNDTSYVNAAGYAIYVRLFSSSPWAMESIRLRVAAQGRIRQRSR